MPPRLSPQAIETLTAQQNVIAAWQDGAPTVEAMRRAGKQGLWRKITEKVYSMGPAEATEEQKLWAAALHMGPSSMLSGQAALVGHGWKGSLAGPMDVLVPAKNSVRNVPAWIRAHRTTVMPRCARTGIPRALAPAAAVDAAGWARTAREAEFIIITALQQKLTTSTEVLRLLDDRPTAPRRPLISASVHEFVGGVHSMGELDFARLCREYGVRQPDRQVWRYGTKGEKRRLDVYFDAERVVVEIDGIGHLDPEQWLDDQYRQNGVVLQGDRVFLRISTLALRYEPEAFMEQLLLSLGGEFMASA